VLDAAATPIGSTTSASSERASPLTTTTREALGVLFSLDPEEQWIADRLAEAPEFTPEQIATLRRLIGGAHAEYRTETEDAETSSIASRIPEDRRESA
jgi:hypothetical protein